MEDQIIAERAFHIEEERTDQPAVVFRLWRPHQPENDYPRCRYALISRTGVDEGEVSGLDGLDCIVTCLAVAGSKIAGLNESVYGGRLRWEGSPEGGRGRYQADLRWSIEKQHSQDED
jgi:hypothetical protein